ncbi:DUF481 domain-containing protein [Litorilituus lipolyticus]|uniref:DUF481 domain-containing protein n=1 Tax=Litorilituus lipolyticus TaxID=2491017 RepID=A0A502L007_9GAMM|nr:DUF481 domain-containing protein [Litorilituus lipolyticus]TPH16129.1 DUF481 domain-containing protein [Litorilituus lipolyticus]
MKVISKKSYLKYSIICLLLLSANVAKAEQVKADWEKPTPIFEQEYDWLRLSSDEWLKGDIVSMYDEELEFDSDELDLQTIDWDDVAELRSKSWQSIRLVDGTIAEGYLVVKDGQLSLVKHGKTTHFDIANLLSIASSGKNERDLWDGYINIGINLREGNTVQFDYTFTAGVQRRSASSRFKTDYTANYSKYEDQDTEEKIVTANSDRLTSTYDWFFSQKIYLRAMDFEYFSDEFLNIEHRIRYGVAVGYHLIDTSRTSWDVNAGPSYQTTSFKEVQAGEKDKENSPGLILGTDFTYEVTSDIDYDVSYNIQFVDEASGDYIHHFQTGLEIELASDFDLDLTFYADRTEKPRADADGNIPEQNDYRLVVSLGYDF